jgi:hypothetical protein
LKDWRRKYKPKSAQKRLIRTVSCPKKHKETAKKKKKITTPSLCGAVSSVRVLNDVTSENVRVDRARLVCLFVSPLIRQERRGEKGGSNIMGTNTLLMARIT